MKPNQINIVSIKKTCEACPSQWEGHLDNGRMFYIRYRYGTLRIDLSLKPTQDVFEAINGKTILEVDYGDPLDGEISLDKVYELMNENELDLPEEIEDNNTYTCEKPPEITSQKLENISSGVEPVLRKKDRDDYTEISPEEFYLHIKESIERNSEVLKYLKDK